MKLNILLLTILLLRGIFAVGQVPNVVGVFNKSRITIEKGKDNDVILPIVIKLTNQNKQLVSGELELLIDRNNSSLSNVEINKIQISPAKLTFIERKRKHFERTFELKVPKNLANYIDKQITLKATIDIDSTDSKKDTLSNSLTIDFIESFNLNYETNEYLGNDDLELEYVTKVESNNNLLTVYGYKYEAVTKRNILLKPYQAFVVNELSFVWNGGHWSPVPISISTVPFKVRPSLQTKDSLFKSNAIAGITNFGFNLDLGKYQMDRYFATGKKSTHKFAVGIWAAPGVEEMDSIYTGGYLEKDVKSKQLVISTGITITYTYNEISFIFIPAGWDFPTSTIGKNWIYKNRRWWGFGIAISPKVFSTVLNK